MVDKSKTDLMASSDYHEFKVMLDINRLSYMSNKEIDRLTFRLPVIEFHAFQYVVRRKGRGKHFAKYQEILYDADCAWECLAVIRRNRELPTVPDKPASYRKRRGDMWAARNSWAVVRREQAR